MMLMRSLMYWSWLAARDETWSTDGTRKQVLIDLLKYGYAPPEWERYARAA